MSTKFCWELRPTEGDADFGEALNSQLPLLVKRLLAQRGISGQAGAERFLWPRLADLSDPFDMRGSMSASMVIMMWMVSAP